PPLPPPPPPPPPPLSTPARTEAAATAAAEELRARLAAIEPDALSPRAALELLYELQQLAIDMPPGRRT
ncbi:MAG: hypothetical protein ACRETK_11155, partial [Steroidobacteraceae bacterium]